MSKYSARIQKNIQERWDIDPKNYFPWVNLEKVLHYLDVFKNKYNISSDVKLAKIMGMTPQAIYQARNSMRSKMTASNASKWLNSLDIDPKRVLVPKAYTVELLEAFPEPQMQEAMIRNRETIKAFINKLESRQQC